MDKNICSNKCEKYINSDGFHYLVSWVPINYSYTPKWGTTGVQVFSIKHYVIS